MDNKKFKQLRMELKKTQNELALLLGSSLKTIRSYEQGWRNIPIHAERQLYFLIARKRNKEKKQKTCWIIKKCPPARKKHCPAWEFKAGNLCWFINGTICEGIVHTDWEQKMEVCKQCEVWDSHLSGVN
jgi:DNA-binding XRE family transcriptional regulator